MVLTEERSGGHRTGRQWRRELGGTLALAWPLVVSNLAATLLTTIDLILIGRLGAEALGAAALATNLFHTCLMAAIGLVSAVAPLVAAEYGRNRHGLRDIRRTVRQGLWAALVISCPVLVILTLSEPILIAAGQQPPLAAAAARYLSALKWAFVPIVLFIVLRTFMAALGRPGWGLVIALLELPVNLALAWILIFGQLGAPALGLIGAGIATGVTATLALLALSLVLVADRRLRRYGLFGRLWRPDWPRFRAVWRVGLPIAAALLLETSLFGASGLMMGTIGSAELAAHTIALQIAALCFMVPLGLGQAATIRVGHALGAGDRAAVGRAGWSAFCLALGFTAVTAIALFCAPRLLIGAFIDLEANPEVVRLAILFLAFAALFQLADGSQVVGAGMLRGLQDTRVPMLLAGIGYWVVGAPLGWFLAIGLGLGGAGLWAGLAIGLTTVAALMIVRWIRRESLGLAAFG
jgi:MATE family multidrug resistance protein